MFVKNNAKIGSSIVLQIVALYFNVSSHILYYFKAYFSKLQNLVSENDSKTVKPFKNLINK